MKARGRLDTGIALTLLIIAIALVKFVPLRVWRRTLGVIDSRDGDDVSIVDEAWRSASYWRRRIDRAAPRLPFRAKCLPRAMVMQWLMHLRSTPTKLVIAVHTRGQPPEGDRFHAYVMLDDCFLIGECELAHHRPLLTLGPREPATVTDGPQ